MSETIESVKKLNEQLMAQGNTFRAQVQVMRQSLAEHLDMVTALKTNLFITQQQLQEQLKNVVSRDEKIKSLEKKLAELPKEPAAVESAAVEDAA